MMMIVPQRPQVQSLLDAMSSFLITESATISELDLVLANAEILVNRLKAYKSNTTLEPMAPLPPDPMRPWEAYPNPSMHPPLYGNMTEPSPHADHLCECEVSPEAVQSGETTVDIKNATVS